MVCQIKCWLFAAPEFLVLWVSAWTSASVRKSQMMFFFLSVEGSLEAPFLKMGKFDTEKWCTLPFFSDKT